MALIIKNIDIVPMTERGLVLKDMDVLIEGSRIKKIAKDINVSGEVLDGKGKLLIPGFINSHTHLGMSLFRNYADDLDLNTWLFGHILPIEAKLTADDIYYGSKQSMVEMIKSGTTSFLDMYFELDRVADAAIELGMRGFLSPGFVDDENTEKRIETIKKLHRDYDGKDGLIRVAVAPHAIYTVGEENLIKLRDLAKELGTFLHIHVSETKLEVENSIKEHGKSPVKYLNELGLFDLPCVAAHCVHLDDEDIKILGEKGVSVAHNPSSNLKLASGIARTQDMLDAGVRLSLGTDGASSNNNLNMVEEIHLASLIAKGAFQNPKAMTAYDTLYMATMGGAVAMGMEKDLGSVEEGKLADLVMVDLSSSHLNPLGNPISALVYSMQASDVETVIINGKLVMVDRQVLALDEEELKKEVNERIEVLKSKL